MAIADFRKLLGTNSIEGTLYEQWLDLGPSPADSGGFLLPVTLVVLRRKPGSGAKVLRGGIHGHIHSDFRDDADSGKGLDTRRRHNETQLGKVLLSGRQNQGFQIEFAQFQAVHVRTDDAELFSLFSTHLSVHSGKHLFSPLQIRGYVSGSSKHFTIFDHFLGFQMYDSKILLPHFKHILRAFHNDKNYHQRLKQKDRVYIFESFIFTTHYLFKAPALQLQYLVNPS